MKRDYKLAALVYVVALAVYAGTSAGRLRRHSDDNHYVWLAHGWLHGQLEIGRPPPNSNDWAQVETWTLNDGRVLRGALVSGTNEAFRTLGGEIVNAPPSDVKKKETKYYVSFPPFPAVVMLPFVALWGLGTNDVLITVMLAGLVPALCFLVLRRLTARGDSRRSAIDDLWLTGLLGVGSVYYFVAVQGSVWYTAHVLGLIMTELYVLMALDARRPTWAGLFLGCGFLCRPEILFAAPLFLWELLRVTQRESGGSFSLRRVDWRRALVGASAFAFPIAIVGGAAAALNVARFGRLAEFGHTYLNVRWAPRIQRYGLFNYTFLGRNLACMLALVPKIVAGRPYVQTSWHGLAIWVTTPALVYLLWPKTKGPLHRPLWITTACIAIPDLLYQNSGWVQFGYRFSLDYMVFLVILLAIGARPLSRWFRAWILVGVAVNLFGAIVFNRMSQFGFDGYFPPGID